MAKHKPTDLKGMAEQLARDCIVTQALTRFIEQVLTEIHATQIAPRDKRIAYLEDICRGLGSPERAIARNPVLK